MSTVDLRCTLPKSGVNIAFLTKVLSHQVLESVRSGEGECTEQGVAAKGAKATGVPIWPMVKVGLLFPC